MCFSLYIAIMLHNPARAIPTTSFIFPQTWSNRRTRYVQRIRPSLFSHICYGQPTFHNPPKSPPHIFSTLVSLYSSTLQRRASRREFHFVEIDGMCTQFGTNTKIWTFICRLRRITFWAYYVNKSGDSIWKRLKISTRVRWERTSGFLAGGKYEISWQIEQSSYYMPIWTSTLVWHLAACVAHGDVRVWKACEVKVEF